MGRKTLSPAEPGTDIQIVEQTPAAIAEAEARMSQHQQAVIEQYGDGLPWQADHYEAEIRRELRRGCEAFLRAGRYLAVARECATHGEWQGMLDRLSLEPRQAQRMMETARRLANTSTSTHLLAAAGTSSKLIELLSLPEAQFVELATDGTTGDLAIDDVTDMTVSELRAAVRKAREAVETRDEQIDTLKDERTRARREWIKATPDAKVAKLRHNVRAAVDTLIVSLDIGGTKGLQGAIDTLLGDEDAAQTEHADFLAGLFAELIGSVCQVRDNLAVAVPVLEPRGQRIGKR